MDQLLERRISQWEQEASPRLVGLRRLTAAPHADHWLCLPPNVSTQVPLLQGSEGQLLIKFQLGLPLTGTEEYGSRPVYR